MIATQITIKQIRSALRRWGKYWRQQEQGKGFSRQAITEQTGGGHSNYFSSDMMNVPEEIELLGQLISKLRPECIRAIRAKYLLDVELSQAAKMLGFDTKRSAEFWLVKAEKTLMLELSY